MCIMAYNYNVQEIAMHSECRLHSTLYRLCRSIECINCILTVFVISLRNSFTTPFPLMKCVRWTTAMESVILTNWSRSNTHFWHSESNWGFSPVSMTLRWVQISHTSFKNWRPYMCSDCYTHTNSHCGARTSNPWIAASGILHSSHQQALRILIRHTTELYAQSTTEWWTGYFFPTMWTPS